MPRRSRAATVSAVAAAERPSLAALNIGQTKNNSTHSDIPTKNYSFDSRRSRDDLALNLETSNNTRAYHVSIPGRPPSPDTSPQSSSLTRVTMVRTVTPDSMRESGETGVIAIGMAIGSPTQTADSAAMAWSRPKAMPATMGIPEPPLEDPQAEHKQEKGRKWGLFRSKSKRTRPAEPQRTMSDIPNPSTTSLSSIGPSGKNASQADQSSKKALKYKPIVIGRSQTEPVLDHTDQPEQSMSTPIRTTADRKLTREKSDSKSTKEPKPVKEPSSGGLGRKMSLRALRGDSRAKRAEKEQPAPLPSPPPLPQLPQLSGPLLNVDIPSIKMERYSVMFNGVLQPQSSSSSLLARRQATLDRLKTINSEMTQGSLDSLRPRRATSPQPKASPTFMLEPDRANVNLPVSPRHRSNTSPALLPSPVVATFYKEPQLHKEAVKARVVHVSKPKEIVRERRSSQPTQSKPALVSKFSKQPPIPLPKKQSNSPPTKRASPPAAAISPVPRSTNPSPFTPDTSSLVLDSSDNTDFEDNVHIIRDKLQPALSEPKWNMVSPPASTTSLSPTTTKKVSPPPSLAAPDNRAVTGSSEADPGKAHRNAVEISIARQISVSHQQRKMLHPLKSNPSLRRRNEDGPGANAGAYIPIEANERLAEIQTAMPRVVHPRTLPHSPDAFVMHRKSSRVVLEGL